MKTKNNFIPSLMILLVLISSTVFTQPKEQPSPQPKDADENLIDDDDMTLDDDGSQIDENDLDGIDPWFLDEDSENKKKMDDADNGSGKNEKKVQPKNP